MLYAQVDDEMRRMIRAELRGAGDAKWHRRLKVIDLSGQGVAVGELAQTFDLTPATMRSYIHAFNATGLRRAGVRWRRAKLRVHSPAPLYVVKRQRIAELEQLALTGGLTSEVEPIPGLMRRPSGPSGLPGQHRPALVSRPGPGLCSHQPATQGRFARLGQSVVRALR